MRYILSLLLFACASCAANDGDVQDPSAAALGVETARTLLASIGNEPMRLSEVGSEAEIETFGWIRESIAQSTGDECVGFTVTRLNPLSADSYALQLHRREGYSELVTGKRYVEIHCLRAISDPELHGIIEVDEMQIVSLMSDGGA